MEKERLLRSVIAMWNKHDLDKILEHYAADFELTSPAVKQHLNIEDGTLKSKEKVRQWWSYVLEKVPQMHFEIVEICESVSGTLLVYKSNYHHKIVASLFNFNEEGLIKRETFFQ